MARNILIVVILVVSLVAIVFGYLALAPKALAPMPAPEESVNSVAVSDEDTSVSLAGTWQSTDDSKFVRTFTEAGAVTDTYEGDDEATTVGTWVFVTDPSKEQAELPAVKDAKVIKIQFPEEVLYFALLDLSETNLSLSYLGRGNTLNFTRVE